MKKYRLKVFRWKTPPQKCNILGVSYRSVCISIATILLLQNICFVASNILRHKIPCSIYNNGFYSLIIQFGGDYWSLAGLAVAIVGLVANGFLLVAALWSIKKLILFWYVGGIVQFLYLISLQTFCFSTKSCNNNCEMDRETKKYATWAFGWCLFITSYFYLTFIFNIHLFYIYVRHRQRPPASIFSGEEVLTRSFGYGGA